MARATKTLGELPNDALIVDPYTTIYGNPIVWHKVSDRSSKTTLRTDKIIKIAAFDAREPSNPEPDYTSPTTPMANVGQREVTASERAYYYGWGSSTPTPEQKAEEQQFNEARNQASDAIQEELRIALQNASFNTFGSQNKGYPVYDYSNLRSWLNATQQSNWYGSQHSYDTPPSSLYADNPYQDDPGFLSGASANFRNALIACRMTTYAPPTYGIGTRVYDHIEDGGVTITYYVGMSTRGSSVEDRVILPPESGYGNIYPTEDAVSHSAYYSGLSTDRAFPYFTAPSSHVMNNVNYDTGSGSAEVPKGVVPVVQMSTNVIVSASPDENGYYTFLWVANNAPPAPSAITVPTAINSGVDFTVSWEASIDPDGDSVAYELSRKIDDGSYSVIYTGSLTSYTDNVARGTTTVTYRVRAYDDSPAYSDYTTSATRTVTNNAIPTISGSDRSLGNVTSAPSITFSVNDEDEEDTLTVTVKLDGETVRTINNAQRSHNYSYTVAAAKFLELTPEEHTITITCVDSEGGSALRTITFVRTLTGAEFIVRKTQLQGDTMPTKVLVSCPYRNDGTVTETLRVCNNINDASPTWEDGRLGKKKMFQNTSKTAESWGVGVWIRIAKNNDCNYISVSEPTIQYGLETPVAVETSAGSGE